MLKKKIFYNYNTRRWEVKGIYKFRGFYFGWYLFLERYMRCYLLKYECDL